MRPTAGSDGAGVPLHPGTPGGPGRTPLGEARVLLVASRRRGRHPVGLHRWSMPRCTGRSWSARRPSRGSRHRVRSVRATGSRQRRNVHRCCRHRRPHPEDPVHTARTRARRCVQRCRPVGRGPQAVDLLAHGTTVATNALLERIGRRRRPGDHRRAGRRDRDRPAGPTVAVRPVGSTARTAGRPVGTGWRSPERLGADGAVLDAVGLSGSLPSCPTASSRRGVSCCTPTSTRRTNSRWRRRCAPPGST